jgi:hypothetical protein
MADASALEIDEEMPENRASGKIPLGLQKVSGHDFSRAERATEPCRALAPAEFILSHLQLSSG